MTFLYHQLTNAKTERERGRGKEGGREGERERRVVVVVV